MAPSFAHTHAHTKRHLISQAPHLSSSLLAIFQIHKEKRKSQKKKKTKTHLHHNLTLPPRSPSLSRFPHNAPSLPCLPLHSSFLSLSLSSPSCSLAHAYPTRSPQHEPISPNPSCLIPVTVKHSKREKEKKKKKKSYISALVQERNPKNVPRRRQARKSEGICQTPAAQTRIIIRIRVRTKNSGG